MALRGFSAPENLDKNKCVMLALVHDLAESIVGDFTPYSGVSRDEKARREGLAIDYISDYWGSGAMPGEVKALWEEFEAGESPESRHVQDVDKVEMMLQALEYEERFKGDVDLGEFFGVARKIKTPLCTDWANEILAQREVFWAGRKHLQGEEPNVRKAHDDYYG
jgi:putative hydrolases of HD superfamily